jgi:adenine-specific DNA-methyltransferase
MTSQKIIDFTRFSFARQLLTVTGTLPSGESCLVLWRDCDVLDYEGVAKLCDKLAINPADNEFDVVYINGDHNIPTVLTQTAEEGTTRVLRSSWSACFQWRMFE